MSSTQDTWQQALDQAVALNVTVGALQKDKDAVLATFRAALEDPTKRLGAINLLMAMPAAYAAELADVLIDCSLSQRVALAVRELFGRLPRQTLVPTVHAAAMNMLNDTSLDYEDYRRLAELLYHLGLDDTLRELCTMAAKSDDPDMRAVAEEFQPEN